VTSTPGRKPRCRTWAGRRSGPGWPPCRSCRRAIIGLAVPINLEGP